MFRCASYSFENLSAMREKKPMNLYNFHARNETDSLKVNQLGLIF